MRLFVAVALSEAAAAAVAAVERPALAGVRWTRPEQWHITLRFVGEVADDSVPALRASLRATALPAATASLGRAAAAFGRSILQVPVDGLAGLAAAVDPVPDRPFAGHVTLARSRRRGADLRRLAGAPVPGPVAPWPVAEVLLVRSHLGGDGSRYEVLDRFAVPAP